jgi:hypothetical protein
LPCSQPAVHQLPCQARTSPKIQVTIMAGLMIALSRRRSMILKVSDWIEPLGASQW